MNLLDLLFDDDYYKSTSGTIEVNASWEESFLHYKQNAMDSCSPPNEYFTNDENMPLLYEARDKNKDCLIPEWSERDVLEQDYELIINYAKKNFKKFEIALIRVAKKNQDSVENLLGNNKRINILSIRALSSAINQPLKEETIEHCFQIFDVIPDPVSMLLTKHITEYAIDLFPSIKLVKLIRKVDCNSDKYESICEELPKSFLTALTENHKKFPLEVFENFEQWAAELQSANYDKNLESIVLFLSEGIKEALYTPGAHAIDVFKKTNTVNEDFVYSLITKILGSLIEHGETNAAFIEQHMRSVAELGYSVSLWMLDYIVDAYVIGEVTDLKLLANLLESNVHASNKIWQRLVEPLMEMDHFSDSTTLALVFDRLSAYHVALPEDAMRLVEQRKANLDVTEPEFFTHYTREEVLTEFRILNADHPQVEELYEYLKIKLEEIDKLNVHANYQLQFSYNREPTFVKRGSIYVYSNGTEIFCKLRAEDGSILTFTLENLTHQESESIIAFLFYQKPRQLEDIEHIKTRIDYLVEWTRDDFLTWRKSIFDVTNENIAEVISVLSQAMHITNFHRMFHLRDCQLIAVLCLFHSKKGRLLQVGSGEGKTEIIAMFNAIKVLQGRRPDISTSSDALALRDTEKMHNFYDYLGITVSQNVREYRNKDEDENTNKKKAILKNVTF